MVERSGSVTDVAGSFLHHLQDICDINVKAEFLKVTPAGFAMARQSPAQQQAWEPGRVGGWWFALRPWVSCSAGSWSGALWGGGGGRPGKWKAWRTHWITTSNNVAWLRKQRQTGQTYMQKKIKDWVTLFGQVCLAASKEERKGCKYNMLCRQRRESQPKACFHVCEVWKIGDMYWALQPHSHPWKAISHQTNLQFKWQQNVCLELSDQISNWDILGT